MLFSCFHAHVLQGCVQKLLARRHRKAQRRERWTEWRRTRPRPRRASLFLLLKPQFQNSIEFMLFVAAAATIAPLPLPLAGTIHTGRPHSTEPTTFCAHEVMQPLLPHVLCFENQPYPQTSLNFTCCVLSPMLVRARKKERMRDRYW